MNSSAGSPNGSKSDAGSPRVLLITLASTILLAILLDRLLLGDRWISTLLGLQIEIKWGSVQLYLPRFGLLPVLILSSLALALFLLPYASIGRAEAWEKFWTRFARITLHLIWMPLLLALGALLYIITKGYLPSTIQEMIGSFSMACMLSLLGQGLGRIEFGLAALLGLMIGGLIWYRAGVRRALSR